MNQEDKYDLAEDLGIRLDHTRWWVVTRKEHRCDLCELPIPKGTLSMSMKLTPWAHPDNEGFGHVRWHLGCEAAWAQGDPESYRAGEIPLGDGRWFRQEFLGEAEDRWA